MIKKPWWDWPLFRSVEEAAGCLIGLALLAVLGLIIFLIVVLEFR